MFHLNMGGNFKSLEECGRFLDLSTSTKELEGSLRLTKRALTFLGRGA